MKDNPYTIFHALGKFLYNKSKILQALSLNRDKSRDWEDWVVIAINDEEKEQTKAVLQS